MSEMVYAALLLHSSKQPVNEENVKKVLSAAGATPDEARVKALVAALEDVDIAEAMKQAAVAPAAAPAAGAAEGGKKEEVKEEKSEEEKEAQASEGLASLFG